jgi:hypothetical protein
MPYKSAHHALICCFVDHARPGHARWQDQFDPRNDRAERNSPVMAELEEAAMRSTFRSTLHGMEEITAEAANVWKHLLRMGDTRASVLVIKTCPPKATSRIDPKATIPNPWFEAALHWLVQESAQLVTGLSNYRARRDAIRICLGGKLKTSITADKCDVSTRTVDRLVGRVKEWISPIEEQAWREIEDRLQAAGLIEKGSA